MPRDIQDGKKHDKKTEITFTFCSILVVVSVFWFLWLKPAHEKATTEREQLEVSRDYNRLLGEQNKLLERIAIANERQYKIELVRWAKEEDGKEAEGAE